MLGNTFDVVFSSLVGYGPEQFHFQLPDGRPNPDVLFAPLVPVVAVTVVYLVGVFTLPSLLRNREAYSPRILKALHNGALSLGSLVLLLLIVESLLPLLSTGLWNSMCFGDDYPHRKRLLVLYYINFLFKFYELFDTLFLILAKKKVDVLQWYHHAATLWVCYAQLVGRSTTQWVIITLNLIVHVLMYYYFFQTSIGGKVWWKKYLTLLQIVQFVFGIACGLFVNGHIVAGWLIPGHRGCPGCSPGASFVGLSVLASYLILFVLFYRNTYKKHPKKSD